MGKEAATWMILMVPIVTTATGAVTATRGKDGRVKAAEKARGSITTPIHATKMAREMPSVVGKIGTLTSGATVALTGSGDARGGSQQQPVTRCQKRRCQQP